MNLRLRILLIGVIVMAFPGCSALGIRSAEEPAFRLVEEDGDFEIREYDELVIAKTATVGEYGPAGNDAFRKLAGYIFAKNRAASDREKKKIAMTAPVLQEKRGADWEMAFVMPSAYEKDELPGPGDPSVEIGSRPAVRVGVIRYSGLTSEQRIMEMARRLRSWLQDRGLEAVSSPISARYDPPWTLPPFRRNEVWLVMPPGTTAGD